MTKILSFLLPLFLFFFAACNEQVQPVITNETVDNNILGVWKVDYSQTIRGVSMHSDGFLEVINPEEINITTFLGAPNTEVTSFLFGRNENIIDIRNDNTIKIYRINSQGGVTISNEQASYFVRNDTLFRKNATFDAPHKYKLQNDSLTIELLPSEETAWTYIISRYSKTSL